MLYQKTNELALWDLFGVTLSKFGIHSHLSFNEQLDFAEKYGADYIDVIVVGSNPSTASFDNSAFAKGTKSRTTIDSWFEDGNNYRIQYTNVVDYKKVNNKALSKSEIIRNLPKIKQRFAARAKGFKIVALGNTAQEALDLAGVEHYKMWHPSGLCRKWNDKEAGEAKIKEMLEWIQKKN
jgi:hypothetical protein